MTHTPIPCICINEFDTTIAPGGKAILARQGRDLGFAPGKYPLYLYVQLGNGERLLLTLRPTKTRRAAQVYHGARLTVTLFP